MNSIPQCDLTSLQVAAGYVTFTNTIMFLATLAGLVFTGILCLNLMSVFRNVPEIVWKFLLYLTTGVLCGASFWASAGSTPYIEFVGAGVAALAIALCLSDLADMLKIEAKSATSWYVGVTVIVGVFALIQQNNMAAGIAVLGLISLLGFTAFSKPGLIVMGFESKSVLWQATFGALFVLVPTTLIKIQYGSLGAFEVFAPAIGWLCTLVVSIGLLIGSTRFFGHETTLLYVLRNVFMVVFAVFCIWAGTMHGQVEMQRIAGTVLVIWIFEKPWDIPNAGLVGYSLMGMLTCGGLFKLMQHMQAHPEFWSHYALF